jgi:hypothetical protein
MSALVLTPFLTGLGTYVVFRIVETTVCRLRATQHRCMTCERLLRLINTSR